MDWDGAISHHATQQRGQWKTYELLISRIFHLICSHHSYPQVTETRDKERWMYDSRTDGSTTFTCRASNPSKRFSSGFRHCHSKGFNKYLLRRREWGWWTIQPSLYRMIFLFSPRPPTVITQEQKISNTHNSNIMYFKLNRAKYGGKKKKKSQRCLFDLNQEPRRSVVGIDKELKTTKGLSVMSWFRPATKLGALREVSCPHQSNMPVSYQVQTMTKMPTVLPPWSHPKQQENNERNVLSHDAGSLKTKQT